MATHQTSPLVVVVGETGSGKSALALSLAKRFNGEIISADARAVYIGMDIGTAKPTKAEQVQVPHHLIDVTTPDKQFTAAAFQRAALQAIDEVAGRGHLPIMVGGTGLYIDSVLFNYSFLSPTDEKYRQKLQQLTPEELMVELNTKNIAFEHADSKNPRRLQRLLETGGQVGQRHPLRPHTLILGLRLPRAELRRHLEQRIEVMFRDGFLDEVKGLLLKYPADLEAFRAPGYKPALEYLAGTISKRAAKAQFLANDLSLAKRQRTWFKRNRDIQWVETTSEGVKQTEHFLATEGNLLQ